MWAILFQLRPDQSAEVGVPNVVAFTDYKWRAVLRVDAEREIGDHASMKSTIEALEAAGLRAAQELVGA